MGSLHENPSGPVGAGSSGVTTVTGRDRYVGVGLGVGEVGVAAAGLADGEALSAAGAGRSHELLMSTRNSAHTTSFMDVERCRHSFRSSSRRHSCRAILRTRKIHDHWAQLAVSRALGCDHRDPNVEIPGSVVGGSFRNANRGVTIVGKQIRI
jgi:hypothetical protein